MLIIESNWDAIRKSLITAVELVASFGFSGKNLTSNNAIIPIAYYLMENDLDSKKIINSSHFREDRDLIKKWLLASLIKGVFGGQSDNVLRGLRKVIKKNRGKNFPLDAIREYFKTNPQKSIIFNTKDVNNLLSHKYQDSITSPILMFLYKDTGLNQELQLDHIYPKSSFTINNLRKKGLSEEEIQYYQEHVNNIGNLQLLPKLINQEKLNSEFDEWFENNYPTDREKADYRLIHLLPEMDYTFGNFKRFLDERNQFLKSSLEVILIY